MYNSLSTQEQIILQSFEIINSIIINSNNDNNINNIKCIIRALIKIMNNEGQIEQLHLSAPRLFSSQDLISFMANKIFINKEYNEINYNKALSLFKKACDDPSFDLQSICSTLRNINFYSGAIDLSFYMLNQLKTGTFPDLDIQYIENKINLCYNEIFITIKELFEKENDDNNNNNNNNNSNILNKDLNIQKILDICLSNGDIYFLKKLYQWLCERQLLYIIFSKKPRGLEDFLKEEKEEEENLLYKLNKWKQLLKYYLHLKRYKDYIHFINYICNHVIGISLHEREQFLLDGIMITKIIHDNIYSSSSSNFQYTFNEELEQDITIYNFDKLYKICIIQKKLLIALKRMNDLDESSLPFSIERKQYLTVCKNIEEQFMDISNIFDIAKFYHIWNIALECLAFQSSRRYQQEIKKIWQEWITDIINQTLSSSISDTTNWIDTVTNELKWWSDNHDISKDSYFIFPISFIIQFLEQQIILHPIPISSKNNTIIHIMRYCGVSWDLLLDAYTEIVTDIKDFSDLTHHIFLSVAHLLHSIQDIHLFLPSSHLCQLCASKIKAMRLKKTKRETLFKAFPTTIAGKKLQILF
ncbi:hypothetical protein RFI_14655 [Reticulomyxa filosa]|uniref:Nucleoporin Nup133/Nup155-like C-terminal domain-containing protein n=1 Tax=Reticulomyxa filosa TaxID=46433 RepID=X6NB59_RETFI|nr:hypothetical protein RFI_14655 [Reticulomyxa filosa]|eukprot:ETO22552.1 hypothetical protein RFI_14655 [Reticulomyxa filosa]